MVREIKAGKIIRGMNFNQKVWALTARVPRGRVTTYTEIAQALKSKAYRAVGHALNRNPYAPAVPCHRVVGWNGALTGYAGGLVKKRAMLMDEGVPVRHGRADMSKLFRLTKPGAK